MKFSFRKQILENCTIFASCVSEFGFDFKTNSWLAYVVHWSKFQGSESSRFGILNYELQINFRFLFQKHSKWSETKLRIFQTLYLSFKTELWTMNICIAKVFDPSLWLIFPLYYIFFVPLKFQSSKKNLFASYKF